MVGGRGKTAGREGEQNKRKNGETPLKEQTDRRGDPRGAGSAAAAQPPTPPRLAMGHYIPQSKSSHGSSHGGARALAVLGRRVTGGLPMPDQLPCPRKNKHETDAAH